MTEQEDETQRAMKQMLSLASLTAEELWERRQEFLRENTEVRERSDREEHCTYINQL